MSIPLHVEALNLRHLRAWVTIVDEGSITSAARRLGVSQPALSQQLRALEQFMGSPLLERFPRGVQPTAIGKAILDDARVVLSAATRLARQAKSAAGLESGALEIATLPTLVEAALLTPIQQWQARYPNVAIRIKEFALQSVMLESVAKGSGDLAIGVRPPRWTGQLVELGWEHFVLIMPPDDPLTSSTEPINLGMLADRSWVLYEPSNGLADYVSIACAQSGFLPRGAVLTSQVQVAINLAAAGLGVALVPSMNVSSKSKCVTHSLSNPFVWQLAAFARKEFSKPAAQFVELLTSQAWPTLPDNATILPIS